MLCSCAHTPRRPTTQSVNEQLIAKGVWWASRVPEAAAEYRVQTPAGVDAGRVLRAAAAYAGLQVATQGVLRRRSGGNSAAVRITVDPPQWVNPEEVLIPFAYGIGESKATTCVVRIRLPGPEPASWLYRSEGEEHCWPRPSARP